MKPITKAHSIAFSFSTAIVYMIWRWFALILTDSKITAFVITFVMSLSFYKVVFEIILFLCKHLTVFKKLLLGKYFFEGIWIGFYTVNGEIEYYYEMVEQTLDDMVTKGIAFGEDREYIGYWTIINPNINISESKLTYYYEMNVSSAGDITLGYSRATVYWNKYGYAYREVGFAIDNFSDQKQDYIAVKIKTPGNIQRWIADEFWVVVKELYNDEKIKISSVSTG